VQEWVTVLFCLRMLDDKQEVAMYQQGEVIIFDIIGQDEQFFRTWRDTHNGEDGRILGYIANVPRIPGINSGDPLFFHLPSCPDLNKDEPYVNAYFYKVCSLNPLALVQWIQAHRNQYRQRQGRRIDDCSKCHSTTWATFGD
jgi:hypothetical protein